MHSVVFALVLLRQLRDTAWARQLEVGDRWGLVDLIDDHTAAKLGGGFCDIC